MFLLWHRHSLVLWSYAAGNSIELFYLYFLIMTEICNPGHVMKISAHVQIIINLSLFCETYIRRNLIAHQSELQEPHPHPHAWLTPPPQTPDHPLGHLVKEPGLASDTPPHKCKNLESAHNTFYTTTIQSWRAPAACLVMETAHVGPGHQLPGLSPGCCNLWELAEVFKDVVIGTRLLLPKSTWINTDILFFF